MSIKARFAINKKLLLTVLAVSLSAVYCKEKHGSHGAHWSYEDTAAWGEASETCANGTHQSPINVGSYKTDGSDAAPVSISYKGAEGATIVNNGHTVQVNYPAGSTITIGDTTYEALQFHFHVGSEHQINGKNAALEMHIVHKSADGKLAVIGLLFNKGADQVDGFFNDFAGDIANAKAEPSATKADLTKLGSIVPSNGTLKNYFKYSGSLTTPPCSEGVEWRVLNTELTTSSNVIESLEALFHNPPGNNRPVQPLNDRTVEGH